MRTAATATNVFCPPNLDAAPWNGSMPGGAGANGAPVPVGAAVPVPIFPSLDPGIG